MVWEARGMSVVVFAEVLLSSQLPLLSGPLCTWDGVGASGPFL